jgi:hypothetical protein
MLKECTGDGLVRAPGMVFLLIPLGGFTAAKLVTNAFHPRYFIGMLPGIASVSLV